VKVAVTGADGFLGWHLRARLSAVTEHTVTSISRSVFDDPGELASDLAGSEAVVHLAGANRGPPDAVENGNVAAAEALLKALDYTGTASPIIYANSIQAGNDTPYGRGKRRARELLSCWADRHGTSLVDVELPNLFGECGQPHYNSFVATFCHRLAHGGYPRVEVDRLVPLLHAQDAASLVIDQLGDLETSLVVHPEGRTASVGEILKRLLDLSTTYQRGGGFPDLSDRFTLQLFNTYRSYLYPHWYPRRLVAKADQRGAFVEAVQAAGGQGQVSFSTTRPGITRGQHYHLRKVERFIVLHGSAEIAIRPVGRDAVATFQVSGDTPAFVDMPTLHTHNITNVGDEDLLTLFWSNEIYDPEDPDTFVDVVS
jgi:UDP-2-acetamido-2,6-beta-L-arabino-hexul-4-ose reductase